MSPEQIRRLRLSGPYSYNEFAHLVGPRCTGTRVMEWETGKHAPRMAYVRRLRELAKELKKAA